MPSESTRARRPTLDRESIVAAARAAIAKEGLEAFSLRRLAAELGVTAPALYAHVSGKEELIGAVAEAEFQRFMELLEVAEGGDPIERIRADCRTYVDHARENPELFKLMFQFRPVITEQPRGDEFAAATRSFQRGSAPIQDAIDAGLFATDDALTASLTIWTAIHGLVSLILTGAQFTPEQEEKLFDSLMHCVLTGLRTPQEK
jgi:AcrR family transcriptional regulator